MHDGRDGRHALTPNRGHRRAEPRSPTGRDIQRPMTTPRTSLSSKRLAKALARIHAAQDQVAARYLGDSGARQPVHTVYGGAHLFTADTAGKLGQLARRALETYGADPPPRPSLSDVRTAAKHAMSWHGEKELELAAELGRLRASGAPSPLVDEAARVLSHHRTERERIARDLAALSD